MVEYYLAEKVCSMSIEERLLLSVENGKVEFYRGETRDVFEVGEDGTPFCKTWDGLTVPYTIMGPLNEKDFKHLSSSNYLHWSRRSSRITSSRTLSG